MIDYRRDPDAPVEECPVCKARLTDDGDCEWCPKDEEAADEAVFECDWCHELVEETEFVHDTHEQLGTDDDICIWCAEDTGRYVAGVQY